MDRQKVRLLRDKLEAHLAAFATEHGVAVSVGSASYTDANVTFKVEVAEVRDGTVQTRAASSYAALAPLMGLPEDGLGRSFSFRGTRYRVTGLNAKASRFPVTAVREADGKAFKMPAAVVAAGLKS